MADEEPRTGELTTANYGWTKPNVGNSDDAWGGMLNADLDGIDSTVHSIQISIPAASSTTPAMDGTAAVGTGTTFARADHVHPSDTTKYNTSNPSGYQTAAQVTASLAPYALTTSLASYLALSGGTMTGAMTLAADPAANLQPATKQYVDGGRLGDNRIINGDMRIDQRNNGASGTATGVYTIDRWFYQASQAAKGTWGRSTANVPGFPNCLNFTSSSAFASAAGDIFTFRQPIEGDMISDFAFGTPNAQSVTLSFWVLSTNLTGTFGGSLANLAISATRSYPFTFLIPTTSTWTKIAITIPGDTAGAWTLSGNGIGACLFFDLGTGTTFRGPANAWASANYVGVTGAVSVVGTNGATFYVTGVKLEIGSVATSYNRQSLAKSMADCQRYFQASAAQSYGGAVSGAVLAVPISLKVTMRSAPTVTSNFTASAGITSPTVVAYSSDTLEISGTLNTTSYGAACSFTASAEL